MAAVNIVEINVLEPKTKFDAPYKFKITFECIAPIEDDIEWKLIYVGSAETTSYDQELDSCMVGPVPIGVNSFEFEGAAPLPSQIPTADLMGVTVVLLTASYAEQEFVRVGYYVNTEYDSEELRAQDPQPDPIQTEHLVRDVLSEKPRVTRYNINWDKGAATASALPADAEAEPAAAAGPTEAASTSTADAPAPAAAVAA